MTDLRYTFTGTLELAGALHIGSGGGGLPGDANALTDATVIRDSQGRPYIPGSSLRGVLRTAISQYAPALGFGEIRDDTVIAAAGEAAMVATDAAVRTQRTLDAERELQQHLEANLLPAERLFGTLFWASPLVIPDLYLEGTQLRDGEIRHGVGINRDTGAAHDGAKYDFEVLPAGLRFRLWLRCDAPAALSASWLRLLAVGLRLLEQGELRLGGRSARGVGQVTLRDLRTYRLDMTNAQDLRRALLADADSERYGIILPADWIRHALQGGA